MLEVNETYLDRLSEAVYSLLNGRPAAPVELPPDHPQDELRQLAGYVNSLIAEYGTLSAGISSVARGNLDFTIGKGKLEALQQLKTLQGNLRHLTWKTQRIAGGDFEQKVDFMGDFSSAFNSMTRQLKEAFEKIEKQNEELSEAYRAIKREKEKSDRLLLNILPVRVAEDLKRTGKTSPEMFEHVTVAFADIVGFTNLSAELDPKVLIDELNEIFTGFDLIVERNGCERIKTIGDAYLAVSGMNSGTGRHARNIVDAALGMIRFLEERNAGRELRWQVRIGIHSGRVVGGVVGIKKYIYDVFGDTINTACRMEQTSEPMKLNISEAARAEIGEHYALFERGELNVKGKGGMKMYFVTGPRRKEMEE